MEKISPILTENMNCLLLDIFTSLNQLPLDKKSDLFGIGEEEDLEWALYFARYVAMLYINYSIDYDAPLYTLRDFYKDTENPENERKLQTNIIKYVIAKKQEEQEKHHFKLPTNHKFTPKDMSKMENRRKGYSLTKMNYYENQNLHDLAILRVIADNRINDRKHISNKDLQNMLADYDLEVERLIKNSTKSDENMLFSSVALYELESHFAIETFYHLACIMEEHNMTEINPADLHLICGGMNLLSPIGECGSIRNSMIKERLLLGGYLIRNDIPSFAKEGARTMISEYLLTGAEYKELGSTEDNLKYIDWFRTHSAASDWASFYRDYDIFSIWQKKEWTPKRIKIMRYLMILATTEK